jgi:hypothetical protein
MSHRKFQKKRIFSIIQMIPWILIFSILLPVMSAISGESEAPDSSGTSLSFDNERYYPYLDDGTTWRKTTQLKSWRLGVIVGGFLIFDAAGYAKISQLQYDTKTTSFHFHEGSRDIREYKQIDKVGHFVEAYYMSHLTSKIYRWAGLSAPSSIWFGSLTGFLWMLQIEITDGFYEAWGFSYYDLLMNVLGCGYSALQQFYPEQLRGIRFKVSYAPSTAYKNGLYPPYSNSILDDYEGINFWMTFNIYDLVPRDWRRTYPGWLAPWGVSLGYGVEGIAQDVFGGQREFLIGLDIDLNKIPTGENKFVKFWKDEFNFIRLPLPAVRVSPTTIWFGFYFSG